MADTRSSRSTPSTPSRHGSRGEGREALIAAAERLFAQYGVGAVSLRAIAAEAGQRNTSAVAYHFGSKEKLVEAIYARRLTPANARHLAQLAELDAQGRGEDLRALVDSFIRPMRERVESTEESGWFLRFVATALYVDEMAPFDLASQPWTEGLDVHRTRVLAGLADRGLPARLCESRWRHFVGLTLHTLAGLERLVQAHRHDPARRKPDLTLAVADLADVATAALTAPVSAETAAALTAGPGRGRQQP
ncbi:TetR/AcrR family transcriptional regulator [Streptomyces sp. NPDC021093]|uniref:TetR/AcrR family transcriptional regulator n=1 Tax=Streptomyces sp. NPDC021093 TaxID=3365112 RepID=UPI0037A79D06